MITKPMLAVDFDPAKLAFPCVIQPKIDGIRGIHLYGKPTLSGRSLKPFPNQLVAARFSHPLLEGIDGELTYGNPTASDLCRTISSVVNTHNDPRASSLILYAFDYLTPAIEHQGYFARYTYLQNLLRSNPSLTPYIKLVPCQIVNSLDELLQFESIWLSEGYEGVIIRSLNGLHKNGRTTVKEGTYLRIKRFVQEDAVVLSLTEAMENTNPAETNELGQTERSTHKANLVPKGMIGSLICRDIKTNTTITVGPGELTHEQRTHYWNNPNELVGQTISYKSFPHGKLNLPRFPTFVTIRNQSDLVEE